MKNLVRGGAILVLTSLAVALIYAQTRTQSPLAIANDSQVKIQNNISDKNLTDTLSTEDALHAAEIVPVEEVNDPASDPMGGGDKNKKLVKKTASVTATNAGASRGAFSATAYCFSGRTAMGHGVRRGLIAADPRVLKLGSRVYVNAGQWSGTYLVSDTGGAIKGKRIDIWVPSCGEARRFGRRSVSINSVN